LEVPHPRWQERLFVLVPLADLVHHLDTWNIPDLIRLFPVEQLEEVKEVLDERCAYQ
jgi:2-amino-4-hydroxy-6-hydroxymethyldihydropteridine diphosphokinase